MADEVDKAVAFDMCVERSARAARALDALKGVVRVLEAVRYQVDLGNNQLARLDFAKQVIGELEQLPQQQRREINGSTNEITE